MSPAQLKRIAVLSLFFSAIPCLLYASYQYIDSGLATTLHFTYPVAVVLISAFLFRSRISTKSILCILICIAGILYAGLGLIAMVLAATLFQIGILRCGAVKSSMLSTVEPVTGVLIGAIVFKEVLTLRSIAGIILILLAVCILALPGSTG